MADHPTFHIRINVISDDPENAAEEESVAVKAIASAFLRMGAKSVTAIADNEQINYVDNEVYNVTTGDLFRTDPTAKLDAYMLGQGSQSLN